MKPSVPAQSQSQSPTLPASAPREWMGAYGPGKGRFDECWDANGQVRPHWKALLRSLGGINEASWKRREAQLGRLIQGNGITYNVYQHAAEADTPWAMDMVPFVLPEADFLQLESALSQRARLLNLVLGDFYGRQTILSDRRVDPYLVYANPAFSRPCHGLLASRENHLNVYAADVARSADGKWWVLSDRVEAASGLGYALDNRMLLSRIFPKTLHRAECRGLHPFLRDFCRHIESLAMHNSGRPNIALLSPGPKNETYYEHSFLARNLGFTLAEGADLTVHQNRLYMKTVAGTQPIDVLLRRVDTAWTDPLEMRNDSLLGVPGLVNCVRQGNLTISNALGSGFVETPAILAFLPWLCRDILGEQLEMPSVATWWCGQPSECQYVLDHLATLVVKPTFRSFGSRSYFGPQLSAAELEELRAKIQAHPEGFCGQEILRSASTPVYHDGRLEPRPYLLRVFLIPGEGGSWQMMPGGFARCAPESEGLQVSMQLGGCSKDVWVVPDAPSKSGAEAAGLRATRLSAASLEVQRRILDLPSRTADNLFWLGRYIERAEVQARLLRTTIDLLLEEQVPEIQHACLPFIKQLNRSIPDAVDPVDPLTGRLALRNIEANIQRFLNDPGNIESLVSNLSSIERVAESLRERLSIDSWKRILKLRRHSARACRLKVSVYDLDSSDFLDTTLENLASLTGDITENMTRGQSWVFLQLGRRIERGLSIAYLLREVFRSRGNLSDILLHRLLELCDCSITYRQRYLNNLSAIPFLEMLVFDATNPRSLMFQAVDIRALLEKLPSTSSNRPGLVLDAATRLFSQVGISDPEQLFPGETPGGTMPTTAFFTALIEKLGELSLLIETRYFAHTQANTSRQHRLTLS